MKSFFETWEREMLRKLHGRLRDQNAWRTENDELQVMYRKPNIVTTIKVRKLEWVGHVVRIAGDRMAKKAFLWETRRGKRSRKTKIKMDKLC